MPRRGKEVTVSKGNLERMPRVMAPFDEMERMFDDFFGRRFPRPFAWERPSAGIGALAPNVDVIDRDEEVVVRAELPGVKKEDIELSVSGNQLSLKGEARHEEKEEDGDYYRCEISRGAFARTLTLPADVDDSKAKASMHDGVLELVLPKIEKSRRHAIKID